MLDLFSIISRGGIVLWYFQRAADIHIAQPVNSLIKTVILQERSGSHLYEAHKLLFKLDNEFELIFVVGYQKMLQLSYIDRLLDQVMLSFRDQYRNQLLHNKLMHKYEFTDQFNCILHQCEMEVKITQEEPRKMRAWEKSDKSKKTVSSLKLNQDDKKGGKDISKAKNGMKNKEVSKPLPGVVESASMESDLSYSHNGNNAGSMTNGSAEGQSIGTGGGGLSDDALKRNLEKLKNRKAGGPIGVPASKGSNKGNSKQKGKDARVWPYGGGNMNAKDLDYSKPRTDPVINGMSNGDSMREDIAGTNSAQVAVGSMRGQLKDLDTEPVNYNYGEESEEESEDENGKNEEMVNSGDIKKSNNTSQQSSGKFGGLFGVFKGLVGSKTLNAETLEAPLEKMREHLIGKNVAAEVADQLCSSVALKLQGKTIGSFSSIANSVRSAMEESLTTILSPKQRIDMLRNAQERARDRDSSGRSRPYVVTFCGVNGVGKSTNLAKICFWLIENGLRVLIAGCDTFRAGAVEQLKTHCRALNALHPPKNGGAVMVQLYEKGYGKDAAAIAQEAINYAKSAKYDVVLVDTAGRMQDNEPLMRALAKLISVNSPDLVLFVGEALVGNEATDQLLKFNRALADHAPVNQNGSYARTIDAIVLTKFDTIDDKVGACVSMTHSTGQPILFVGTGQTYSDLKVLNVTAVVNALLRS